MEEINYLNSGALGDLILLLYVIKKKYDLTGKKGNLFVRDTKDILFWKDS